MTADMGARGPSPRGALSRSGGATPPIRIVHFGLGAFHRAHQAWYTAHAGDAAEWGIAAFTGRQRGIADTLTAQDGLYTLIQRGPERDDDEIVTSLVEAIDGADLGRLLELFAAPALAIVTLTVTESGYRLRADGSPDLGDPELRADLDALRSVFDGPAPLVSLAPTTILGRLLLGLEARRRAGGRPLAVVPCDNLPGNGAYLRRGVTDAAQALGDGLAAFVAGSVSFVSTSVDRITPRTTRADIDDFNARAPWRDDAPVVTEPFTDWVLSGAFPAGRPAWEDAGARFVDDIEPWELRKLRLLNGAHTLLAFAGPPLGHETVAEAIADPRLRGAVDRFWDEAARSLPASMEVLAYRAALLSRFANARIEHRLAQIAEDGTRKLRLRILPVAEAELRDGRLASGCAVAIAAWADVYAPQDRAELRGLLARQSRELADSEAFVDLVHSLRRA